MLLQFRRLLQPKALARAPSEHSRRLFVLAARACNAPLSVSLKSLCSQLRSLHGFAFERSIAMSLGWGKVPQLATYVHITSLCCVDCAGCCLGFAEHMLQRWGGVLIVPVDMEHACDSGL